MEAVLKEFKVEGKEASIILRIGTGEEQGPSVESIATEQQKVYEQLRKQQEIQNQIDKIKKEIGVSRK